MITIHTFEVCISKCILHCISKCTWHYTKKVCISKCTFRLKFKPHCITTLSAHFVQDARSKLHLNFRNIFPKFIIYFAIIVKFFKKKLGRDRSRMFKRIVESLFLDLHKTKTKKKVISYFYFYIWNYMFSFFWN